MHLILAPGASHSGYEDHFQADPFHYLHHRYFSCNFAGANAAFLDVWFGSFTTALNPSDLKGGASARPPTLRRAALCTPRRAARCAPVRISELSRPTTPPRNPFATTVLAEPRPDGKSTLRAVPDAEFMSYLTLCAGCLGAWAAGALEVASSGVRAKFAGHLAFAAGFGPVVAAELVTAVTRSGGGAPNNKPWKMAVLLVVGTLFCSLPISWAGYLALSAAPGE